jgi:hypothetical protein
MSQLALAILLGQLGQLGLFHLAILLGLFHLAILLGLFHH